MEGGIYVLTFWKAFMALQDMAGLTVEKVQAMVIAGIYVLMLLVLLHKCLNQ